MNTPTPLPRTCSFGPLTVEYDDRVLTPRQWTLAQSEWAADLARAHVRPLLELCAGAGHIGLAAAVLAGVDLVQVELDPVAAAFADANARRAGWRDRVDIRVAALHEAVHAEERFAVIVADPPYLPTATVSRWPDDPPLAIDGGADGMHLVSACLALAAHHLDAGGCMLLQLAGPEQALATAEMLPRALRTGELRITDPERAILRIDRA